MTKLNQRILRKIHLISYSILSKSNYNTEQLIREFSDSINEILGIRDFSFRSKSLDEYIGFMENNIDVIHIIEYQRILELFYNRIPKWKRSFYGHCDICNRDVNFIANIVFDARHGGVNWRESLTCPYCGFNNRIRAVLNIINERIKSDDNIYISEQVTSAFRYLSKKYKNIVGSEFLGDDIKPGTLVKGIRHEDLCNLSFDNVTFDAVVSLDVLEHVVDYKTAVKNIYRILKTNGVFIFSVPFIYESENDEVRSVLRDGKVIHLMEPEIHGNPVDKENGALVYTIPSWKMIRFLNEVGFTDAYANFYFSIEKGHLACADGSPQVLFIATK